MTTPKPPAEVQSTGEVRHIKPAAHLQSYRPKSIVHEQSSIFAHANEPYSDGYTANTAAFSLPTAMTLQRESGITLSIDFQWTSSERNSEWHYYFSHKE